jgi:hypothetical protein
VTRAGRKCRRRPTVRRREPIDAGLHTGRRRSSPSVVPCDETPLIVAFSVWE